MTTEQNQYVAYRVDIDADANIEELLILWANGQRDDVLHCLKTDHAGLTALFIVEGLISARLDRSDCNRVSAALLDHRKEIFDKGDQ